MVGAPTLNASNVPNMAATTTTMASAVPRQGIVVSKSLSEHGPANIGEDGDDLWALEEISEGIVDAPGNGMSGKHPPMEDEIKLREAALKAQHQCKLSYS